jgi:hypothetical protein
MAVTNLLAQSCNKSDLLKQTGNKQCEHNLLTACEQTCNKLFADLLQFVRFYVCNWGALVSPLACDQNFWCEPTRTNTQHPQNVA